MFDEWFVENQLAVENGLGRWPNHSWRNEGSFEEHYVQIPEEKYDVLKSMVEKLDDMETNEQIEKNIASKRGWGHCWRYSDPVLKVCAHRKRVSLLAESVEFESDEEYREKLETLKESYFTSKAPTTKTETLSEGVDSAPETYSGSMESYLKTLSAFKNWI